MAFVAKRADGEDVPIPMDETVAELRKALPKDHPLVAKVARCFEVGRDVIETWIEEEEREGRPDPYPTLDALVLKLDDWRAGIRDWDEVEQELDEARRVADWA